MNTNPYAKEVALMAAVNGTSEWRKFQVTLFFGGDDCPNIPDKIFTVTAKTYDGAINNAIYDAMALGYKRAWVEGNHVEVL